MNINLEVQSRKAEIRPKILLKGGFIPGIVYGPETKPISVQVQRKNFEKIYKQAGESNLIDLTVDSGSPLKVLVQEIQTDPILDSIIHVDFRQINMKKVLHTKIPLAFTGESAAVKELAGVLVKNLNEVEVKCLPSDLVSAINVDISVLKIFNDVIHVKDLNVPGGITILNQGEDVVVKVIEHKEEEEVKGPETVAQVEVISKKKEEGEEGEGAASGKEEKT